MVRSTLISACFSVIKFLIVKLHPKQQASSHIVCNISRERISFQLTFCFTAEYGSWLTAQRQFMLPSYAARKFSKNQLLCNETPSHHFFIAKVVEWFCNNTNLFNHSDNYTMKKFRLCLCLWLCAAFKNEKNFHFSEKF